jgi:hypothetical protein
MYEGQNLQNIVIFHNFFQKCRTVKKFYSICKFCGEFFWGSLLRKEGRVPSPRKQGTLTILTGPHKLAKTEENWVKSRITHANNSESNRAIWRA